MAKIATQGVSNWLSMEPTLSSIRLHVGTLALNFEHWTLNFRISPLVKMICWQEACRDARLVRPFRFSVDSRGVDGVNKVIVHAYVGTHGPCVRFINHTICFQFPWADARTVRPYMLQNMQLAHTCQLVYSPTMLGGRTNRASLHASCLQIILSFG